MGDVVDGVGGHDRFGGIDAILWDNDGVLVDTERLYFQATRETMARAGVELDKEAFRRYFLRSSSGAWHLLEERGVEGAAIEALKRERDSRHRELLAQPGLVIDGAREVLSVLAPRLRMAIVTSAWRVHFDTVHRTSGLRGFFEFVLTREDYRKSKPDPEPYLAGLARLGVPAERCVVIEDSERGLAAARAAGLRCFVIPADLSEGGDFSAADRILADIREVPGALASVRGAGGGW